MIDQALIAEIASITGSVLYMSSYGALQRNKEFAKTLSYTLMNLVAPVLVLYSCVFYWNSGTVIAQFFWFFISAYGLKDYIKNRRRKLVDPIGIEPTTS